MGDHYGMPPWELADVPEDEVVNEAERLDVLEEMAQIETENG